MKAILYSIIVLCLAPQARAMDYNPQALKDIGTRAAEIADEGGRPVVVFDIDDTLTDSRVRSVRILSELGIEAELHQIAYHMEDTFRTLGITETARIESLMKAWAERFFTSRYCALDTEIPGAAAYARWLVGQGAFLVYLTGRDEPHMLDGTREGLRRNGFPADQGDSLLLMKPRKELDDTEYKKAAFERIARLGTVVGVFENEPRNINAMHEAFPEAVAVYLDTIHSRKPDVPADGVSWVRDFNRTKYRPYDLELVLARARASVRAGHRPVVLFDLDETLINSRTRSLRILRDLARGAEVRDRFPLEAAALEEAGEEESLEHRAYRLASYPLYLANILGELGIENPTLTALLAEPYTRAYLSNDYCAEDAPMPGAVAYARAMRAAGATIVYITGRNRPNMGRCTEENLERSGFPAPARGEAVLVMKPRADLDDTEFKREALPRIGALGEVVGGFENEPANVNAFQAAFPQGTYGFVDDTHSRRSDRPNDGIFWIRDFRRARQN